MVKYPSMVTSTSQRWLQLPIMLCWTWDPSGRFPPAAECDTFQYSNRTHLAWNPIVTPPSDRRCHRWCHSPLKLQFWGIPNFSTKPHHVWGESGLPSLSFGAKMGQGLGPRLQPLQNILDYMMWGYKTYPPAIKLGNGTSPHYMGKSSVTGCFFHVPHLNTGGYMVASSKLLMHWSFLRNQWRNGVDICLSSAEVLYPDFPWIMTTERIPYGAGVRRHQRSTQICCVTRWFPARCSTWSGAYVGGSKGFYKWGFSKMIELKKINP